MKSLFTFLIPALLSLQGLYAQSEKELLRSWEPQIRNMVQFLEYGLNLLGNDSTPAQDKEIIIRQSYARIFRDAFVQIEDDLIPNRKALTNKDVTAYLRDVDFFFRHVVFSLQIKKIRVEINQAGFPFFLVELHRQMQGIDIEGNSVKFSGPRFMEIVLDQENQDLKIVSIYTNPIETYEELSSWWAALPVPWKTKLSENILLPGGNGRLSDIVTLHPDAMPGHRFDVSGQTLTLSTDWIGPGIARWLQIEQLDLSGQNWLTDTEPLSRFTRLKHLNLSGTPIENIDGLRSLTGLRSLDLSQTRVRNLSPLSFASYLEELNLAQTTLDSAPDFGEWPELKKINLSRTRIPLNNLRNWPQLRELILRESKITSLKGIHQFSQLRILDISHSGIRDLEPLSGLQALTELRMEHCPVSSLLPLAQLPGLKSVFCDGSPLDARHVQDMILRMPQTLIVFGTEQLKAWWVNLPEVWQQAFRKHEPSLGNVGMPSREALHALLRISSFSLPGAEIYDIRPLRHFPALRFLDISNNPIADFSPLADLVNLETLHVEQVPAFDLRTVKHLSNLRELKVNHSPLTGINALNEMKSLQILEAEGYDSDSLLQFQGKIQILWHTEALTRWWNGLSPVWQSVLLNHVQASDANARTLHAMEALSSISVHQIFLDDISPLSRLRNLERLELVQCGISSLDPLEGLSRLTYVDVSQNPIRSADPLKYARKLHTLKLSRTAIADFTSLRVFPELRRLDISSTPIRSLKGAERLVNLEWLDISATRINKLNALKGISLKTLWAANTDISQKRIRKFRNQNPDIEVIYY